MLINNNTANTSTLATGQIPNLHLQSQPQQQVHDFQIENSKFRNKLKTSFNSSSSLSTQSSANEPEIRDKKKYRKSWDELRPISSTRDSSNQKPRYLSSKAQTMFFFKASKYGLITGFKIKQP